MTLSGPVPTPSLLPSEGRKLASTGWPLPSTNVRLDSFPVEKCVMHIQGTQH